MVDGVIDLTGEDDEDETYVPAKRQRLEAVEEGSLETRVLQVLQFVPDADINVVRSLLQSSPAKNDVVAVSETVETILLLQLLPEENQDSCTELSSVQEDDREVSLALAEELRRQDVEAMQKSDAKLAADILYKEHPMSSVSHEPAQQRTEPFIQDPLSHPHLCMAETTGRLCGLLKSLSKHVAADIARVQQVNTRRRAVLCTGTDFFCSSLETNQYENEEEDPFHLPTKEGDIGWGCGYRNIQLLQMLASHLLGRAVLCGRGGSGEGVAKMSKQFPYRATLFGGLGHVPCIEGVQAFIEAAWVNGYDIPGAEQLGKLVGSKKWIGTSEVCAMLRNMGIRAQFVDFKKADDGHLSMMKWVQAYFEKGAVAPRQPTKFLGGINPFAWSSVPPLYLQHQGHSRTIVGFLQVGSKRELLMFDPGCPAKKMESAVVSGYGWQRTVKRGVHTLRMEEIQIVFIENDGLSPFTGEDDSCLDLAAMLPDGQEGQEGREVVISEWERESWKVLKASERVGYETSHLG